jgi:asparagine synthase (glutamine-hydrolysing)
MCGILGNFAADGNAASLDVGLLRHRGPDSSGEWRSPSRVCWLGHTRLAILDLSETGHQPMSSADGACTLVFNGEIYNHREVRASLPRLAWRGGSDTETLLEAWAREGVSVLPRLRGMFAFAVYDARDESLTVVRDRLGIKPLYYRRDGKVLAFASEVRALCAGRRPDLDSTALRGYLATGHLPGAGVVGDGIEILPPGHWLRIERTGTVLSKRWWPAAELPRSPIRTAEEARAAVRECVETAVIEHLLADVPVASFLSGGVDSSIVSIIAARHHSEPLRTFSVGFPQQQFDERPVARLVAERGGTRHTEIVVSPTECLEWIVDGVQSMDLPSADAINTFIISKAVRAEGIKVALSGLGADELFGGYPSFRDVSLLRCLNWLPPAFARGLVRRFPKDVREKLDGLEQFDAFSLALARRNWWSCASLREAGINSSSKNPELPETPRDSFAAASWAELLGYMEPMLLRDSDQMSMSVALELRVPFLDHRLVGLLLSLPAHLKRGRPPKRLLIQAFEDDLPQEVWRRPKQGFSLPMNEWMRGPLRGFCREGIDSLSKMLTPTFVRWVADRFEHGLMHWTRLWQLTVLGHYARRATSV